MLLPIDSSWGRESAVRDGPRNTEFEGFIHFIGEPHCHEAPASYPARPRERLNPLPAFHAECKLRVCRAAGTGLKHELLALQPLDVPNKFLRAVAIDQSEKCGLPAVLATS